MGAPGTWGTRGFVRTWRTRASCLAAFFAARHDGGVEALAETNRQIVELVRAVDLDGLARGAEGDFAVIAAFEVVLQLNARLGGYRVVDQIIKEGEELSAGHVSSLTSWGTSSATSSRFGLFELESFGQLATALEVTAQTLAQLQTGAQQARLHGGNAQS